VWIGGQLQLFGADVRDVLALRMPLRWLHAGQRVEPFGPGIDNVAARTLEP
jgi:hypothetical protein